MILKQLKDLQALYDGGEPLSPEELRGEYDVLVPWYPWISLKRFKHRKSIDSHGRGVNMFLDELQFGQFQLRKDGSNLLIDYHQTDNKRWVKRVVDRLRRLPDGRIIGKLYYKILGREIFLMFFEMKPTV